MNFKDLVTFLIACLLSLGALAQYSLTGNFPLLEGQQVKLLGIHDLSNYPIDSITASEQGVFTLRYADKDLGMGYLTSADNKHFMVILSGEEIELKGESFAHPETIEILKSKQNQLFAQYASEHPRREQALSAWDYLTKIYTQDALFASHKVPQQAIEKEKQRIKAEDSLFLKNLNKGSFVSWYLPLRKLVSSVSTIAQYRTNEIPATIKAFRNLDYTDERLYKSGLLHETIESHFWLIENSGRSLDSVFIEMNISIDCMVENLSTDAEKLNLTTDLLFKLLEKRSLFKASEHLALKVLNEAGCTINNDLASQLESYRAMKTGNTAPDFKFHGDVFAPAYTDTKSPDKFTSVPLKSGRY